MATAEDFVCIICLHRHYGSEAVEGWLSLCTYCKTGHKDPNGRPRTDPPDELEDQAQPEDSSDS